MIKSLIMQLSQQSSLVSESLKALFEYSYGRRLSADDLLGVLKLIISVLSKVYIVIDALYECSDRGDLLLSLEKISD
jgi:hypothetical protein